MSGPESEQSRWTAIDARLMRLEESAGFVERTSEQVSAEVRLLNARVGELLRRLDALEGRLSDIDERVERAERGGYVDDDSGF